MIADRSMETTETNRWQLHRGQYLGEVSALCFLHLPANLSSLPLLLAGSGSQIQVYDLESGAPIRSFQVFEGIRVHGISLENFHKHLPGTAVSFQLSIYGERRVMLFTLHIEPTSKQEPLLHLELNLIHSLPKFSHWVLDVCFLKDRATASEDACYLAIGCSDNFVYFWDISRYNMYSQVKCAERCLLYSMRMFGDEIDSLRIASGTIFNEVVVWKIVSDDHAKHPGSLTEDPLLLSDEEGPNYRDALISRLVGHEGSIFRIAWFSNGTKLVSASDDRSARIWDVQTEKGISCNAVQEWVNQSESPVLFGHSARIWDCCIFESLIITAGEDCTCRVWDHHGRELNEIKEHIGRGVWRCLYDPSSSLLVTAGFDSAIKLHQLLVSSKGIEKTVASEDYCDKKEAFVLSVPKLSGHGGLMDSKSEYVRCLNFSHEDSLYVATNNGYLYHVNLHNSEAAEWTELARISEEAPIICMDLLSKCSDSPYRCEDSVAIGDGKGRMTIVHVVGTGRKREVEYTFTWPAEGERHLLDTYWCKLPEARFIFTSDPGGKLKLWKLCHNLHSSSLTNKGNYDACLIAEYASCFGKRIMCLDASFDEELIACGDIRGNLLLFSLPRSLLYSTSAIAEVKASQVNSFKGAHGVSSVNSVSISSLSSDEVELRSTGADGCICYLQYVRDLQSMEFIGMKQVKELSAIRSVFTAKSSDSSAVGKYAVGFASENFIIWNLTTGTKVQKITCGGWRRPHSYYLGHLPEMMNCFSFVKDDTIYIHRHWVPENNRKIYPQNLHLQFHGREIHSLCFIHRESLCTHDENNELAAESSWIATGCEDGTVRLTRYEVGMDNWSSSQHLGDHVSGSAVRSICSVSKMHLSKPDPVNTANVVCTQNGTAEARNPLILISVGAKRVVTAWKQTVTTGMMDKNNNDYSTVSSAATMSSVSFQWLSTDMPLRHNSYMKRQNSKEDSEAPEDAIMTASDDIPCESVSLKSQNIEPNLYHPEDNLENDWRYLDVTAFLVKEAGSRISVCFVIVACSDATVTLRALVLPFRIWFDVASLAPLSSPVLALQHVVIPNLLLSKENIETGSLYLAITGSTDGSIAIWDLTECIENFMRQIPGFHMENCIDFQKRPRTGRGSQGGRRWRSIESHKAKKKSGNCKLKGKADIHSVSVERTETGNKSEDHVHGTSEASMFEQRNDHGTLKIGNLASLEPGRKIDDLSPHTGVLEAKYVLDNVHQSGVNCLYVSDIKNQRLPDSMFTFYVVSGGDDQAINCLRCDLELDPMMKSQSMNVKNHFSNTPVAMNNHNHHLWIQNHQMQISSMNNITSAHSSAVKGIWTDGIWVFSVGLDQRVRCWNVNHDRLTECAHLIISVPEPEALDVKICGRNHYQIAVAGRGMQMIEFRPTNNCI